MKSLLLILCCSFYFQMPDVIKGVVKSDDDHLTLPGVSVVVEKDGKLISGTTTNMDGEYVLNIPDSLKVFTISYHFVGMKKKSFVINRTNKNEK